MPPPAHRGKPARLAGAASAAAALAAVIAAIALAGPAAGQRSGARSPVFALANRCFALRSVASGRLVGGAGRGHYSAGTSDTAAPQAFWFKPTGLGTYMLSDRQGKLVAVTPAGMIGRSSIPGPRAEFAPTSLPTHAFALRSTATGRILALESGTGIIGASRGLEQNASFQLLRRTGCRPFPEAQVDATVLGPGRRTKQGRVFGFVDDHVHVTANLRAGAEVISGEPFDRFGIEAALGQDAKVHGPDGRLDLTGNLLRTGLPIGTHDTHGWPTFKGWPTFGSMTHQQAYYVWLERAWRAGMRMMVAQTADDEPICRIEPRRATKTCSETSSIVRQIAVLKGLERYVDAQSGGPGRGWFRLVYTPVQARRVMEAGKLAVLVAIESSDLFGCSERGGQANCTRADVDRGLARYERLGVRGMFVAHWVNNAFAGAALEGGAKGIFINILNRFQTGRYFKTTRCPHPGQGVQVKTLSPGLLAALGAFFPAAKSISRQPMPTYPTGLRCNARGLTPLGRYLIGRLIANHMLIEVDHLSEFARDEVLAIAAKAHYPLISSHNGTGGEWSPSELTALYRLGGFAAVTPDVAPKFAAKILAMARFEGRRAFRAVGLGTDTGGFASLPGPRPDAGRDPLRYPFKSFDGSVSFTRERTGTRRFDLNRDGVAQYGLVADLLGDTERTPGGRRALALLFNSAEAYLDAWQRAVAHR